MADNFLSGIELNSKLCIRKRFGNFTLHLYDILFTQSCDLKKLTPLFARRAHNDKKSSVDCMYQPKIVRNGCVKGYGASRKMSNVNPLEALDISI